MKNSGFLSSDLDDFKVKISERFPRHYKAVIDANSFAQHLQYEIEIQKTNTDQILGAILYARTISTYQAFIIVSQRGMINQSKMLLRCMLDSLFPLVAIQKNKGYSKELIDSDEHDKLKNLNKLLNYRTRQGDNEDSLLELKLKIESAKSIIKDHVIKRITYEKNAQKAGLQDWYDTLYSVLSITLHSTTRSLQDNIVIGNNNEIECLKNEPEMEDLDNLLVTALEAVLFSINAIGDICNINTECSIRELRSSLYTQ